MSEMEDIIRNLVREEIDALLEDQQDVFKKQADVAKATKDFQTETDPISKGQKLVNLKTKEVALADAQARAYTEETGKKREELAAAKEKEKMARERTKRQQQGKAVGGLGIQSAV
jgi:uncharacterized protein YdaT